MNPLRLFTGLPAAIGEDASLSGRASLAVLIAVNLIPVVGVLCRDWSVFEIVSLYWFENVVLGVINILKILTCSPDPDQIDLASRMKKAARFRTVPPPALPDPAGLTRMHHGAKLFLVPFFTVHYGLFCLVHGVFVFTLLGGENGHRMTGDPLVRMRTIIPQVMDSGGAWFVWAIVASHLTSFLFNYIGKGEYRRTTAVHLMIAPYGRIVVLHIAILFGAFVITALGSPVFLLLLLIAGKIVLDLALHLRSHAPEKEVSPG